MAGPTTILEHIGRTPLVPLPRIARGLPVPVLVKCEHMNPGGSVKDRIAKAIVDDAERRGVLGPGMTLIEATAGNTGVGLALVAAARGYGARLRDAREDVRRQARRPRIPRRPGGHHAECQPFEPGQLPQRRRADGRGAWV